MSNEIAQQSFVELPSLREQSLDQWLTEVLKTPNFQRLPLAGDASFRRYFRIALNDKTYVVMDSPPPESPKLFVEVAKILEAHGLTVPKIWTEDLEQGFLLLSDFGDRQYLKELNATTVDTLYQDAFQTLLQIQTCQAELPHFDRSFLQRQFNIFEEWYLKQHRGIEVTDDLLAKITPIYELLFQAIEKQPKVFVHRDYHSRNLMILDEKNPGVIDFQDAMIGPITYDLVSLLQDCYIAWPHDRVEQWVAEYQLLAVTQGILTDNIPPEEFLRWFHWTGLQRHLKNLGIFSRLYYRDNKEAYLNDIPLVSRYIQEICQRYEELKPLADFFAALPEKAVV